MAARRRNSKYFLIGTAAVLAVLNLALLFCFSDRFADRIRPDAGNVSGSAQKQAGAAVLTVRDTVRTYDGSGIFNPMDGITACEADGSDITHKVAVAFVSGNRIDRKTIRYTVFGADGARVEASSALVLENYRGPSLRIQMPERVSAEQLEAFPRPLVEAGALTADDGFGRDAAGMVTCSYELDPETQTAELTFSLTNGFQDYCTRKIRVFVEDFPDPDDGFLPVIP